LFIEVLSGSFSFFPLAAFGFDFSEQSEGLKPETHQTAAELAFWPNF